MRLGRLFERIAFIDDRLELARLDQLFDENQIFGLFRRQRTDYLPAARHRSPQHLKELFHLEAGEKMDSVGLQRVFAA